MWGKIKTHYEHFDHGAILTYIQKIFLPDDKLILMPEQIGSNYFNPVARNVDSYMVKGKWEPALFTV